MFNKGKIEKAIKHMKDRLKYCVLSTAIDKDVVELSIEGLEKQLPKEVIKIEKSSQVCPICKHNVNWKYCSNCGQSLKY